MAYAIDVSRGECRSDLSRQWASRPDDERFVNLTDLYNQTKQWADESRNIEAVPANFDVTVVDDDLAVHLDGEQLSLNHYSMNQLSQLAGVPASYLRDERVPPDLAALCLVNGLASAPQRGLAAYVRGTTSPGPSMLRALTSPRYGRIYDHEVVASLMTIAGNGTGDQRWKIPGTIGWGNGGTTYDSETAVTKQSTTLFASDRNMFCFLADDRNPVEVGKLANGEPDYMFRGLMAWNSEVMERTYGLAGFWLRGVCENRNLWGVENFQEIIIRHTSGGPGRFAEEVAPYLEAYAEGGVADVAAKVQAARALTFRNRDYKAEEQLDFLVSKMGFNKKQAIAIVGTDPDGQGETVHVPENVWELANAATAWARTIPHQDARLDAETRIGRVMDTVDA